MKTSQFKDYGELPLFLNNEYIEKAIHFYTGYLDTQNASAYLPRILSDILEGKLGTLGSRMGRLLFKLAVEQNMTANILASEINVGLDTMCSVSPGEIVSPGRNDFPSHPKGCRIPNRRC